MSLVDKPHYAITAGTSWEGRKQDPANPAFRKSLQLQLEHDAQEASRQAALRSGTRHRCINIAAQTFTFSIWPEPNYCPLFRTIWPHLPPPHQCQRSNLISAITLSLCSSALHTVTATRGSLCACRPSDVSHSRRAINSSTRPSSLNSSSSAQSCKLELYPTLEALFCTA